jgi:hypothetical protein
MSESRKIWLRICYQDKEKEVVQTAGETFVVGRKSLQELFGVNGDSFKNISRNHLEISYDEGRNQFCASDQSMLGTLARVVGDEPGDMGPEFLYHRKQFLLKRRMWLRLQNENAAREPDDVIIEIDNDTHEETRPILDVPAYWDRLLNRLRSVRAAHLVGLPGTGKSTLAKKLTASRGTMWQRQRDRQLGGPALVAWVDCRLINKDEEALWHQLGRRMLSALQLAAEEQYLFDIRDEIKSAVKYFETNATARIGQMNTAFRQALRAIVKNGGMRPVFVFDHFDNTYGELDKFMLYQLYQMHEWHEIGEAMAYVIITRRPLAQLRKDNKADGVMEFYNLFARYAISMTCWQQREFKYLWQEIAPGHTIMPAETHNYLYQMSGGMPALARELYEELAINDWLDRPHQWGEKLDTIDWHARPPRSCNLIWQSLTDEEQTALSALPENELSRSMRNQLRQTGVLNDKNQLFSPLFQKMINHFYQREQEDVKGLDIDPQRKRVFVNGNDVTPQLRGRKLDVLFYLHKNANQLCTYEALIKDNLPPQSSLDMVYMESERGALQRAVSRLCKVIDPQRQLIQNEQGVGYRFTWGV